MKELEIKLDSGRKILLSFEQEKGYSITIAKCWRANEFINKRQDMLDIIEGCQKELEVIYEHDEK